MKIRHQLTSRVKSLLEIKKTERLWHFPFLAGICIGICLLSADILENLRTEIWRASEL